MGEVKKKYLRDYLNSRECEQYLIVTYMLDEATAIKENWTNLTKEEMKYLKYANTYASKWSESVMNRIKKEQVDKLYKWTQSYELILADKEKQKQIDKKAAEVLKTVSMERELFEDWCSEIIEVKCKNCTKHWTECNLHKMFLDNAVPESEYDLENCRYAYK